MTGMSETVRVSEIFRSLQGEGTRTGWPCVLVRLAGCNLRCRWCDTPYARDGGEERTVTQVLAEVARYATAMVEVTGGEPLVQPGTPALLRALCDAGYETLLETNGSVDLAGVDARVVKIMDVKCPSSGASASTRWENLARLSAGDEVKFVLAGREDYEHARRVCAERGLCDRLAVTFSPVAGELDPAQLAEWILADGLRVRLGLQLHKILWPDKDRGV